MIRLANDAWRERVRGRVKAFDCYRFISERDKGYWFQQIRAMRKCPQELNHLLKPSAFLCRKKAEMQAMSQSISSYVHLELALFSLTISIVARVVSRFVAS